MKLLISPQTISICKLLTRRSPLTAKEIGKELGVFPHAVYRSIKQLKNNGLVYDIAGRPVKFALKPPSEAIESYLLNQRGLFQELIGNIGNGFPTSPTPLLIKDRDDLLEKTNVDVKLSKISVDFIVSGLEVPAETILVYKEAIDRGVQIRSIVQRLDESGRNMFQNWKKIGLLVKYYPSIESRLFIIDNRVVYLASYDPKKREECVGVRIIYGPFAKLLKEVFARKWNTAKEIE